MIDEKAFDKFVESGYDAYKVDEEEIDRVAKTWLAYHLVPLRDMSWEGQERRRRSWPWIFYLFIERLQHIVWDQKRKLESQKELIISLRKEISALKRAK